jgi:hypothetical protein
MKLRNLLLATASMAQFAIGMEDAYNARMRHSASDKQGRN